MERQKSFLTEFHLTFNEQMEKQKNENGNSIPFLPIMPIDSYRNEFMTINGISCGQAAAMWNRSRFWIFSRQKAYKHELTFKVESVAKKIKVLQYYNGTQPPIEVHISYLYVTQNGIYVGNNYGIIINLIGQIQKKVHAGAIKHITHRQKWLLTCSEDCTTQLINSETLQIRLLLKDAKYMKEVPIKGHFIDDLRVAVCSRACVKVFSLLSSTSRVSQTILTVDLDLDIRIRNPCFCFRKDVLLYLKNEKIMFVLLDQFIGKTYIQSLIEFDDPVDSFCLTEQGLLAVGSKQWTDIRGIRIDTKMVVWRIQANLDNPDEKFNKIVQMQSHNDELFVLQKVEKGRKLLKTKLPRQSNKN